MPLVKVDFSGNNKDIPVRGKLLKTNDRGHIALQEACIAEKKFGTLDHSLIRWCWSAGLCWALHRCLEVPMMCIRETEAWQDSGAFETITSKLSWVAANSTALQVLIVWLFTWDPDDHQAPCTQYKLKWVHALAQQLAACSRGLQTFRCRARDLDTFPVIPNLKHLMLDVHFAPLHNGVGSLTSLASLETLHLEGHTNTYGSPAAFDCPPLQLSCLSRLRRLALVNVIPEGISVSSCCAVFVKHFGTYISNHPFWSALCIDSPCLRSVDWADLSYQVTIGTPEDIPRAMREASCLDRVNLSLLKKWSCERFPPALARVRKLIIHSESIILSVPAKVQWQYILIYGWAHLNVVFEDVGAFAKVPMNFSFSGKKPFGRSWLPLDAAMVQY